MPANFPGRSPIDAAACCVVASSSATDKEYVEQARKKAAGSLRRMTVFVRHENVGRLLKFFGYRLD